MQTLMLLIAQYGLLAVFLSVLVEQLGAPIPAYPILLLAGAMAARGEYSVAALLLLAVLACLIADGAWYLAGRRHGRSVLGLLCRISLSPDACVRQTEAIFVRWGAPSLTVAKFVPGFASVATAMAGAMRIRRAQFLLFDAIGATLWAGLALALGWVFSDAIEEVLLTLVELGKWGLGILGVLLSLWLGSKWLQRQRFQRELRMERVSVQALASLMDGEPRPIVVDVRSAASRADGAIPGALAMEGDVELPVALHASARDTIVVTYCACPNEASAVLAARRLMAQGFKRVLPLRGGIDAWRAAGLAIEPLSPKA